MFLLLFLLAMVFQSVSGFKVYNEELVQDGYPVTFNAYLHSGHFISATFGNWESEFLQMLLFITATIFLYQKGSSESKDPEGGKEESERAPNPRRRNAPWPVKKDCIWLALYKHSLSIVLALLFLASIALHFYGSLKDGNNELMRKGLPPHTAVQYFTDARFWFESMQNWQSEFLSVFAIVLLSVYFRQIGSSQSKPVDAPYSETGG